MPETHCPPEEPLRQLIARHWGFRSLRPMQEQAMRAVLERRDSLVVLPTGGGKSLCFQAPAALREDETTVVVSPLIALMKDQVDALQALGVPAAHLDSLQSAGDRSARLRELRGGGVRLLFVSPERLTLSGFQGMLRQIGVRTFAIDEAHCISHWGHDFRPEYRQLRQLRAEFPEASFHAYTATATEQVRADIIAQLGLREPEVLVGNFDRPNLTYRVVARHDLRAQVLEVLARHPDEAGIIYCIRRKDVDDLTAVLKGRGYEAMPYHAGLSGEERKATQEAFRSGRCDLVVATVAFGMGIDRSNVRFVLHTGMPKSVEHYQQEAGRAGRDGLEAECVLLYSGADSMTWKSVLEKSAAEAETGPDFLPNALRQLAGMNAYCRNPKCRHRMLVEHFNQPFAPSNCGACDLCLGDVEFDPDGQVIAQKILSCVARVKESFGVGHVVAVLRGEQVEAVRRRGHDKLSTFGLLRDYSKGQVRDWAHQLIGQGVLEQAGTEYPLLKLNPASWEVMRGGRTVRLLRPAKRERLRRSQAETASWEGVDRFLFAALSYLRRQLAAAQQKPPYLIFNDDTLRELTRVRPSTREEMRHVRGVGELKLRDWGEVFLDWLTNYPTAYALFQRETSVDEVAGRLDRPRSRVGDFLAAYVALERPASIGAWVSDDDYERVAAAVRTLGGAAKPEAVAMSLRGKVAREEVRVVLEHLRVRSGAGSAGG